MSSAFNNSEKNQVVSLTEDSTLKWRGLLNNTYASKESKHMRNRNEKSSSENSTTAAVAAEAGGTAADNSKVDVAKETNSKAEQKQEITNSVSVSVQEPSEVNLTKTDSESEQNAEKREENVSNHESNSVTEMSSTDKTNDKTPTAGTTTQDKKSTKSAKSTRNLLLDVKSDRSLRSKGSVSDKKSEELDLIKSEQNVKRGRGRKKKAENDTKDKISISNEEKTQEPEKIIKDENNEEKPRIVVTIRQNRSTNSIVIPNETTKSESSSSSSIKKRGRRGKQQTSINQEQTHILTRSAHKDENTVKRPLRRIRPTAKILASEELREGFVQQNCARLNITDEEIQHMEEQQNATEAVAIENKRQTRENKRRTRDKDETKNDVLMENITKKCPSPTNSIEILEVKRSLSFSDTSSSSKISYTSSIPPPPPPVQNCPEPMDFLREIRNAKLALPKSPEDNKKLNKKQQKRLMKMKEKHLFLLGLKRTRRIGKDGTDSDDISDENDEFVPARKVVTVGKPGVTLRLRNFRKEEQASGKRRSPNFDQILSSSSKKRRAKEHRSSMKISLESNVNENEEKLSSPKTTTLVPVSMSTPISSSSMTVTSATRQMLVLPASQTSVSANVSDIIDLDDMSHLICLCIQPSKYFLQRTAAISHCCAIDEVEGQKIGCTNEVHGDLLQLLRPSVRTSYMVLCDSHKKRLVSHNCCAGCGVFLTQGIFSLCPNRHFFHRDCTMKYILNAPYDPNSTDFTGPTLAFKCPHCGVDVPDSSFRVTMKCENVPVFFTNQKHHM